MMNFLADIQFQMPDNLSPQDFVQQNIVQYIMPNVITFISAVAGIAVFKGLIRR